MQTCVAVRLMLMGSKVFRDASSDTITLESWVDVLSKYAPACSLSNSKSPKNDASAGHKALQPATEQREVLRTHILGVPPCLIFLELGVSGNDQRLHIQPRSRDPGSLDRRNLQNLGQISVVDACCTVVVDSLGTTSRNLRNRFAWESRKNNTTGIFVKLLW